MDFLRPERDDYASTGEYNAAIESWKDRMGRPNPADFRGGAASTTYKRFLYEFNQYINAYPGIGARDPRESPYNAVYEWSSGVYTVGEETVSYQPYEPPPPPPLSQEEWLAANPAPTYADMLDADPTVTQLWEDLRDGKTISANEMAAAENAVQQQFNQAYDNWLSTHDTKYDGAPLPKRDYAAERGYTGNVPKPEASDFRNGSAYNQAMNQWGSTVRNVPPPVPSDFSGPGGGGAMQHATREWELQQQQVDDLVSFKRALFGERAINDSLQRHPWDYDTYVIDPNLYMDRLLESRDAYKEYDQEQLQDLGFYAFDMRYTTLADGTVVDNGQLTTQQWRDFSSSGGRTFGGSYGYEEYDAIHKYNNMISRGVDADTAEEWFEGYSDDMDGRGQYLSDGDKLIAEEFERKRQGYVDYMDELIESGDIGAYLEAYEDSPHHLKMTLLESRRDRGFIEEDDFKSQFVSLLNQNSDNTYFYYDVWNEQFVAGPSLSTEEKERRGEDGKLIFDRDPRIELFTATPYALAQMGIGDPEDYFEQSTLGDVTDVLFPGFGGDPRDMWKVVSENIYDSFKDQDDPEDTMKQYDLLYGQKAIGQEQSYWDSTQDQFNSALNSMSTVVSLIGPVAAAVMVTLKAANGQTITTGDYVTIAIAGLQVAGKVTPPASAADAQKAADAAETASKAAGASDEVAAAAGAAEKAKLLAGVGLGAMTYRETILLIDAIGSGDPKEFLMTTYGGNFIQSGFAKLGITTDNFSPAVIQGLNKVTNKMLVGDSFEEALASAGSQAVKDWINANGVGNDIEAVLKEYGLSMSETTRNALSAFDDDVLQPIIGGIENAIGIDFSDIDDVLSKFDDDVLQPIFDDFEAIADKIDTKVLTPITDAATSMLDGFINTSKAAGIPLDSMDAVRERLKVATGDAFKNLPEAARDAIEEGLKDAVVNGEINEAAMTQALASATITTKIVEENIGEYANDVVGARLMTQAINSAVVSAALGGDASDAFLMTIGNAALKAAKDSIRDGTLADDLATMSDKVTGEFTNTRLATEEMDRQQGIYDTNYANAAAIQTQMGDEWQAVEDLQTYAEATGRQSDIDAYNNALTTYIDKVATEYQPLLEQYDKNMNDAQNAHNDAAEDFNNASTDLNDATTILNDNLAPAFLDIEKGTVSNLAPGFDEAWYRQKHDIPEGDSAYDHYLQNGLRDGDAANAEEFGAQYDAAFDKLMNTAITASGINPAKLSPEELQRIRNQLINRYGRNGIQGLKDGLAQESALKWRVQSSLMALSDLGNAQDFVLTEQNIDSMKERLEAAGIPFEDLKVGDSVPVSDRRNLAVAENNQKSSMSIELGGATDWADVVSGDAQLTFDPLTGALQWNVLPTEGMQSVSYDDEYGLVLQGTDRFGNDVLTVQENNNQYAIVDGEMKPLNGTFAGPDGQDVLYVNGDIKLRKNQTITEQTDDGGFRFYEANANNETQVATYDEEGNLVGSVPYQETDFFDGLLGPSSFESLMTTDPELWLSTLGEMPESVGEDVAGNWWYRTAKRITNTLNSMAESGQTIPYVPYGVSSDYLYMQTLLNKATDGFVPGAQEQSAEQFVNDSVNSLQAMNEFMQSINWTWESIKQATPTVQQDYMLRAGIVIPEGESIADSKFQQVTQAVGDMAQATHTEEYRAAQEAFQKVLADDGLWEAIDQFPSMFAQEIVMHELKQELPTLLIGGVAKLGGTLVSKGLGMSDEVVASVSAWTGFTGAVAVDMAEAYGGEAGGAYTELYDLATTPKFNAVTGEMEAPMTEEEAEKFASENAHLVGVGSVMLTGLTMGMGGADMYKSIFGKDLAKATVKERNTFLRMYESLRPVGSEAITGAMEEGGVAAIKESIIYNSGLDPDRDYSQNIITSAQLGFILEGTVAGAVTTLPRLDTGSPESRILVNGNGPLRIELVDTLNNGGSSADVGAVLDSFGIEDTTIRTDILDLSFDSEYNSSQEVSVMFEDLGFAASEADIANFVGAVDTGTDLTADVAEYIDPLFTDRGEVQEAALAEGVILTDEEADLYVGQDTEENVTGVLKLDIQDPDTDVGTPVVTVDQIKNEFLSNGRIITDAQAEQFLGTTLEDAQEGIGKFLATKPGFGKATVGTGFIRAAGIDDHGVYLTGAQMQQFLNKYGVEDISAAIGEWVASEPEGIRYTITEQQVRDYAESLGYTLSDEEVAQFTRKAVGAAEVQLRQRFQNDPEFGFKLPEDGKDGQDGTNGVDGIDGVDGASAYELAKAGGYTGTEEEWLTSLEGVDGTDGNSAYDIAVANGYDGTVTDWLESLRGTDGARGARGFKGKDGQDGTNGVDGVDGVDGKSAYELAKAGGYTGTEEEWLDSLKGVDGTDGNSAYGIAVDNGYTGSEMDWLESLKGTDGARGARGKAGEDGTNGTDGVDGVDGASAYALAVAGGYTGTEEEWLTSLEGVDGTDGNSAYDIAVANGYEGTVTAWLDSLRGTDGARGARGLRGYKGTAGQNGTNGVDGVNGVDGKSAYEIAVDHGYIGSESEWLDSLQGVDGTDGNSAYDIAVANGYLGTRSTWLESLKGTDGARGARGKAGEDGTNGVDGVDGVDGASAYELAKAGGYTGTEQEWLDSLEGVDGTDGNSAYDIAVANGYEGTVTAWLASLRGTDGAVGARGLRGFRGKDGQDGTNGVDGINGVDGASAYELAKAGGYTGTEQEWLDSLKAVDGTNGNSAYDIAVANGYEGSEVDWLESLKGTDGAVGARGKPGQDGTNGVNGVDGVDGKSAYELAKAGGYTGTEAEWLTSLEGVDGTDGNSAYDIAVANGYEGTVTDWLESLRGTAGARGARGLRGYRGKDGQDGTNGVDGINGVDGASAYALAVEGGYTGTEEEWLDSLKGVDGKLGNSAYDIAVANGYEGTEVDWLESLKGTDGAVGARGKAGQDGTNGVNGVDGVDGASAYALAVEGGYTGTEQEWLTSLQGVDGTDGNSAYDIAVANGYTGSESDWLESLKGTDGARGARGVRGYRGFAGQDGTDGVDGVDGVDGASAYALAKAGGYTGTEEEWLTSLQGVDGTAGNSAYDIAVANGYDGSEIDWLTSLIGARGATGATGKAGQDGTDGVDGVDGVDGASAYALAVEGGYTGTEEEWLTSLEGVDGTDGNSAYDIAVANGYTGSESDWLVSLQGTDGARGARGKAGQDGTDGVDGINGVDGASAYALAVEGGYTGTEQEWLTSLEGVDGTDGNSAYDIAVANGYEGTESEWVASLQGTAGARGARGLSAYEIAVEDGFVGTETEWLASLESNVTDLGDALNKRIDELESESGDRDAAIAQAVNELAKQQGTDIEALTELLEEQKSQTAAVAEVLGKPERAVTQEDIDNVAGLIASQDVLQNPEGYVPTSEDMLYDVNNDGVIDSIDQVLLQDSFAGEDVQFAAESQFGDATGLYLQIAQQNELLAEQEAQRQADLEAQQQAELEQQQAYSDANYLAEVQAQREQLDQLGEQAIGAVQQQVSVSAPKSPLTQIDYLFDVYGDEIFATPQQKELFASPYGRRQPTQRAAQGGIIQTNDELLRLLGD